MHFSAIDSIVPASLPSELPLRLEQHPSRVSTVLKLTVLLPATLALLTPFLLVASAVAADPAVRAVLAARPASIVQLAFGLAFWGVLFAWPLKRLAETLAQRRTIEIVGGRVRISDQGLLGARTTETALADYTGVIHHVRSSLSGLRHELILAHEDRDRSVLLAIADRFSQAEIDRASRLLGLCEMHPRVIYSVGTRSARMTDPAVALARAA